MIKAIKHWLRKLQDKRVWQLRDLASCISQFYCSLYDGGLTRENVSKVVKDVEMLGISNLAIKGNEITITLRRPGLLIGRRGSNIEALQEHINKHFKKKMRINIKEDTILQYLIPYFEDEQDFG